MHFHADRLTVMRTEKWGERIREIGEETLGFAREPYTDRFSKNLSLLERAVDVKMYQPEVTRRR